ncbi:MAG: DegT/DnrJ/EryC1/StrS family aminotransferase, partial [Gammaproteobacteria bacterium]
LGTYSAGSKVGDCQYSDITVFSFHPVKTVTTGEGGVATTRSQALAQRMELLRTHGITRDEEQFQQVIDGAWHYEQIVLGFNYRMTDIAAALGVSQLDRLSEFINRRAELADLYCRLLRDSELPVQMQKVDDSARVSRHLFIIRLDFSKLSQHKNDVVARLLNDGVTTTVHYRPIYLQPYYHQLGFPEGYAAEAEKYYAQALSLPLYPALKDSDVQRVVSALVSAVR